MVELGRERGLFEVSVDRIQRVNHTAKQKMNLVRVGPPGGIERERQREGKVLAFSPDGALLFDGENLIDTATGQVVFTLSDSSDSVAFSNNGEGIALSSHSQRLIEIWNVESGQLIKRMSADVCLALNFSPDDRVLVAGVNSYLHIWDTQTWTRTVKPIKAHYRCVTCLAFSPYDNTMASGSSYNKIKIWSTEDWRCIKVLGKQHIIAVMCLLFLPPGNRLASGYDDHTIKVWDTTCKGQTCKIRAHQSSVCGLYHCNNGFISWSSEGGKIAVWDKDLNLVFEQCLGGDIRACAVHPDGSMLVTSKGGWWSIEPNPARLGVFALLCSSSLCRYAHEHKPAACVLYNGDGDNAILTRVLSMLSHHQ